MKQFFALTWQKAILTIFVVVFAPLPFFGFIVAGFAPPVLMILLGLAMASSLQGGMGAGIIFLFMFLLYALCLYVAVCVAVRILERIAAKPYIRWTVTVIVSALLFYGSFHRIYMLADMVEGRGQGPWSFSEMVGSLYP